MLSRWLRWLVIVPVVLFVFGATMLSCGGSSGSAPTSSGPSFALESITISNGPAPTPTFFPTSTSSKTPAPTKTPTLTPRPAATSTTVPTSVPTGGTVAFNAIGTFMMGTNTSNIEFQDITTATGLIWTSANNNPPPATPAPPALMAPPSGPDGGMYTTANAGCVCVFASSSGLSSQQVGVGVYVDVDTCPLCPTPLPPTPTATKTPKGALEPAALSTPAPSGRSAGVLMWTFDPGAELRGRIATGADGSIFFITRDGVLHGLNSSGKETMHREADGSSPAVLPDGTVVAMSSGTELAAIGPDGATRWNLEIGASAGPLAATDRAIYASAGSDLVSVRASGTLNWR